MCDSKVDSRHAAATMNVTNKDPGEKTEEIYFFQN